MIYHELVSDYGGVPLIMMYYSLEDEFAVRGTRMKSVLILLRENATKPLNCCPLKNTGANNGRATKGLRFRLIAGASLRRSDLHNYLSLQLRQSRTDWVHKRKQSERWLKAKNAAKAVIDLNLYSLYKAVPAPGDSVADNIANIFVSRATEEDIFVKFFTTTMGQRWGLYTSPNGYHGWGTNAPIAALVDDFEMKDGKKFDWSNPAHAAEPYKNRDQRFYATILFNGASWRVRPDDAKGLDPYNKVQTGVWKFGMPAPMPSRKFTVDTRKSPIEDWNGSYTGYYCRKYLDPNNDAQYVRQSMTWRFFRYAEILLN
jgi:hypothetical protein